MISNETNRITYPGNGSTTVFPYTFKIFDQDDILVTLVVDSTSVATTQTITTHYTVSGAGTESGGNVTFITAPASGVTVVLTRNQPLTQDTDYTEFDAFPAESHEEALDKAMAAIQMLSERLDRALTVPISSSLSALDIALSSAKAGYFLKANSTGTGFELVEVDTLSGTFADVSADASPSLGGDLDCAGNDIFVTGGSTFIKESTDARTYFGFTKVSNGVNYFNFTNAATGSGPNLAVFGNDTNIDFNITPKGTGSVVLNGPVNTTGLGTFNAGMYVKNGATSGGFVRLFEDSDNGTNYVNIASPNSLAANYTLTLPTAVPSSTQLVTVDTSGNMAFEQKKIVQVQVGTSSTRTSGTSIIPQDNTIPQNTEGTEILSKAITPTNASNTLIIDVDIPIIGSSATNTLIIALFQDSTANALAVATTSLVASYNTSIRLRHSMTAGTTSSTTFKVRIGHSGGVTTWYHNSNDSSHTFGGITTSYLTITEVS